MSVFGTHKDCEVTPIKVAARFIQSVFQQFNQLNITYCLFKNKKSKFISQVPSKAFCLNKVVKAGLEGAVRTVSVIIYKPIEKKTKKPRRALTSRCSPSSVLRDREGHAEPRLVHSPADGVHVQQRAEAVRAVLHAALSGWAEAAVVQPLVTPVMAALLQGDSGG